MNKIIIVYTNGVIETPSIRTKRRSDWTYFVYIGDSRKAFAIVDDEYGVYQLLLSKAQMRRLGIAQIKTHFVLLNDGYDDRQFSC